MSPARIMRQVIFLKKWICSLLIFTFIFLMPFAVRASSGAFLVMDGRNGTVLEAENEEVMLPMASTTKIMTALVVLEHANLEEAVTIPAEAAGVEGSSLYIKTGEVYTVEELLYALMLESANDCAVALAWYVGGESVPHFVEMMNQRAQSIGLIKTHFANPNGLSAAGHYTTAKELALMMMEAMKNEAFRVITGTKRYTVCGKTMVNHNRLLSLYDGCIGGKTGYTMEAGRCLVTAAERNGAMLICVTLGRKDDWNIHTEAYVRWYQKLNNEILAERNSFQISLPRADGGSVTVTNCDTVAAYLFQYDGNIEKRVLGGPFVYGNKGAGDVVGTVEYWFRGAKVGESPLVLCEAVQTPIKKELFIARIFRFFRRLFLKKE